MCLKFDPEENTLKQTCSGKCKNKCGFKVDIDDNLMEARKVRIGFNKQTSSVLKDTPLRLKSSSLDTAINSFNIL